MKRHGKIVAESVMENMTYAPSRKDRHGKRHGKRDLCSVMEMRHGKRHIAAERHGKNRHGNRHPNSVTEMRNRKRHGMSDVMIVSSLV